MRFLRVLLTGTGHPAKYSEAGDAKDADEAAAAAVGPAWAGLEDADNVRGFHLAHEVGKKTGFVHWHAAVWLKEAKKLTMPSARAYLAVRGITPNDIKFLKTNADWDKAIRYISKEDKEVYHYGEGGSVAKATILDLITSMRAKETWADVMRDEGLAALVAPRLAWAKEWWLHNKPPTELKIEIELLPWQHQALEILRGAPMTRRIIWIWSRESRTGKTTFLNYLRQEFSVLTASGKLSDIYYAMGLKKYQVVHLNLARGSDFSQRGLRVMLEELSDHGAKTSGKYQTSLTIWSGHFIVTTNDDPATIAGFLPGRAHPIWAQAPGQVEPEPEGDAHPLPPPLHFLGY